MKHLPLLFFVFALHASAQGPQASYYYDPSTQLSWAKAYVHLRGGSQQGIPFLPVVRSDRSPSGTMKYSKDVDVDGRILFAGNGIVDGDRWDSYAGQREDYTRGPIDATGKIVMLCYDFPDSIETLLGNAFPVERRIALAAERKAAGVILFSHQTEFPFLFLGQPDDSASASLPVITVTKQSAAAILESGGIDGGELFGTWRESRRPPESRVLISRFHLRIEGAFPSVQTDYFSLHARQQEFSSGELNAMSQVNVEAHAFLRKLFKGLPLRSEKLFIVYFRDFDSKFFYTHHRGWGLADGSSIFNVQEGAGTSFGIAVHEDTHTLWEVPSTSFLDEGISMYAQAMAEEKDQNHVKALQFLKRNELYPLAEMMTFQIGLPGKQTEVGYPASGSFVQFLIDRYSLESFYKVFALESRPQEETKNEASWKSVYRKSVSELEKEWHQFLMQGKWGQ